MKVQSEEQDVQGSDDRVINEGLISNLGEKDDGPDGGLISNNVLGREYAKRDDGADEYYQEDCEGEYNIQYNADKHERNPEEHRLTEEEDDGQVDD